MAHYQALIIILLIVAIVAFFWLIIEHKRTGKELKNKFSSEQSLALLQQQMAQLRDTVNMQMEFIRRQLNDSGANINERMISAANMFGDVKKEIGGLHKASEQILAVGQDIATLHEILSSPKLRGGFGEYLLSQLIQQVLPKEHFIEQHRFFTGDIVDIVIRIGKKLLPIDAKFPLENFKKMIEAKDDKEKQEFKKLFVTDIKKHLQAIAEKYILPDEGTFEFAFMYIPAENIYYEIISGDEAYRGLIERAMSKKVFFVSPSTLYAHLQIIVLGLKGLAVEKNVGIILDRMARLKTDIDRFADDFMLTGKHLGNTRSKYDDAEKRLSRLMEKIADLDKT